jgi:putative membrane protein
MMMFEPKRLHPAAAVINSIKQLKELVVPAAAFLIFGSGGDRRSLFFVSLAIVGILIALISGILTWLRFTYRIEDNELRLEFGVFVKKKRYIPLERIQSIDRSEGIMHRPFGLVQLKIETAGGGAGSDSTEASLTAITREEAARLEDVIFSGRNLGRAQGVEEPAREDYPIYKLSPYLLFIMASTSGGVGVVISAVLAFLTQFDEFIPYKQVFSGFETIVESGIMFVSILVFMGFLIAWVLAITGMMIKYGNYTVGKMGDDLIISRGLLEKRKITIPLKRIQAIQITQNPLREMLGYAAVHVESAGGSAIDKDSARVLLLPLIKVSEVSSVLSGHLPAYQFKTTLVPVPKRALSRYMLRNLLITLPVAAVVVFFFRPWGYAAMLLPILGTVWAYSCYRAAGWGIDGGQLSFRFRNLAKVTVFMTKNKIQSLDLRESYFQKRKKLARVEAYAKSGAGTAGGSVQDVDAEDALFIYNWYSAEQTKQ